MWNYERAGPEALYILLLTFVCSARHCSAISKKCFSFSLVNTNGFGGFHKVKEK